MKDVIRTNADGIDVNYGTLHVGNIGGIPFAIDPLEAELFGIPGVSEYKGKEFPQFFDQMHIRPDHHYRTPSIWALEREDLPALGEALCKHLERQMSLSYKARFIRVWVPGQPVVIRNIEDFYEGLTEEEIALSKFEEK